MDDIDPRKLEKMWKKIIEYEKGAGTTAAKKQSVSKIVEIISEVTDECY